MIVMNQVPVVLLGPGAVGRALLRQIVDAREHHRDRRRLLLAIVGVADSSGAVLDDQGIGDGRLHAIIGQKAEALPLSERADASSPGEAWWLDRYEWGHGVVVDCTATADTAPWLRATLERGWDVVLANKLPLVGPLVDFHHLTSRRWVHDPEPHPLRRVRGRAMWEATVGSGLPVIAALERLLDAGDRVATIEGTFSGTLNFVATELRAGRPFSEIVREAERRAYTEPDPRTDLSGDDLARKALILARMCGINIGMSDVDITPLYPPEMDGLTVAAFMERLSELDSVMARRVDEAADRGAMVRSIARIDVESGRCSVGPETVPLDSPLGRLQGTDNLVTLETRWYEPDPLVLQGRGAGVDATAAGVLADIVALTERAPG